MRHRYPAVLFDLSESQVNARRNSRRSVDVAVLDPERIRFDADSRIALGEFLAKLPVPRGAPAVEQELSGLSSRTWICAGSLRETESGVLEAGIPKVLLRTRWLACG